ncbi:MAG: restriction endonuclease subunit S [Bergeyella sp.]
MSYKRLGDYIQQVNVRNKNLEDLPLLGVSNTKKLISSIANTIGTDMSAYKIIERRQFAYGTVTSRNGDRLSVAISEEYDKALVSQIYIVFQVVDTEQLLPEYLMMWFSRPEFDRYARFHSHGSTRETFDWEDMCDTRLPVPPIEKQRAIVAQYQAVADKIKVNEQICEKLETTAQALYKYWFVGNRNEDWERKRIDEVAEIKAGGDKPRVFSEIKTENCPIPIFANGTTDEGLYGYTDRAIYPEKSITISARGTIGYCVLRNEPFVGIVRLLVIIPFNKYEATYLIKCLNEIEFADSGSVQSQLTIPQISNIEIVIPPKELLVKYDNFVSKINSQMELKKQENQKLVEVQSLLLSRLAREKKKKKIN